MPELKKVNTIIGFGEPIIDNTMKTHENGPVFIKQAERAKEFLRLHSIPDWMLKKHDNK